MRELNCTICGHPAEWVKNSEVYGGKIYGKSYMIWLCRNCGAFVGCHENTRNPLGTFADKELRQARMKVHAVIDPLWKSKKYARKTVYLRLKEAFGEEIHVGESDKQRCEEIIKTAELIFQE